MHKILMTAAALAMTGFAANAAEYVGVTQSIEVARPPAVVMQKTGGFCDIGAWLKTTCEITSGTDRELGAVRKIAGRVEEVLVSKTPTSYTYAMTGVDTLYHGAVSYEATNGGKATRIVYTAFSDVAKTPTADAKATAKAALEKRLQGWLSSMKAAAEG